MQNQNIKAVGFIPLSSMKHASAKRKINQRKKAAMNLALEKGWQFSGFIFDDESLWPGGSRPRVRLCLQELAMGKYDVIIVGQSYFGFYSVCNC